MYCGLVMKCLEMFGMIAFLNMAHTTGDIMITVAMSVTPPHAVSRLQWALSSRGRLDFAKYKLRQGPWSACWAYLHQHEHVQTRKVWAHAWYLTLAYALAHVMGATFEAFTRSVDEYGVKSWVHSLAILAFYGMMCNMYSLGVRKLYRKKLKQLELGVLDLCNRILREQVENTTLGRKPL